MSGRRIQIDIFVKDPIPSALVTRWPAIVTEIRRLKSYASKINEGLPNEEMTVRAVMHICRHDEGGVCDPEVDI